jgi:uncharacterized protein (TIGR02996 family)
MSLEKAFLAEIVATPDDDAPRLVYADWLDENGQPERAEAIRLGCELRKFHESDPRAAEIARRLDVLQRDRAAAWRNGWPSYAHHFVRFECGLPSRLYATATQFRQRGKALRKRFPITSVSLRNVRDRLKALAASGLLEGLRELDLAGQRFTAEDVAALAGCAGLARLRRLNLRHCSLDGAGVRALLFSPHLAGLLEFGLCSAHLDDLDKILGLGTPPPLRKLGASNTGVNAAGAEALAASPLAQTLEFLDLGLCNLGEGAAALAAMRRLRVLVLRNAELRDPVAAALLASPALAGVEELDLSNNPLGPEAAAALAGSPHARSLRTLKLSHTRISGGAFALLAGSPVLSSVRVLVLDHVPLSAGDLEALARSPHAAGLVELEMGLCGITDDALAALASSRHLTNLRNLHLYGNHVGPDGARALARSAGLAGLRKLNFYNNQLGDEGAAALAAATWRDALESMRATSNGLGDAGKAALRAAYGDRVEV